MSLRWLLWWLASPSQLLLALRPSRARCWCSSPVRAPGRRRAGSDRAGLALTGGLGLLLFGLLPAPHYPRARARGAVSAAGSCLRRSPGIVLLGRRRAHRPCREAYGEPQLGARTAAATSRRCGSRSAIRRRRSSSPAARASEPGKGTLETRSRPWRPRSSGRSGLDPPRIVVRTSSRATPASTRANVRALVQPAARRDLGRRHLRDAHAARRSACFRAAGWADVDPVPDRPSRRRQAIGTAEHVPHGRQPRACSTSRAARMGRVSRTTGSAADRIVPGPDLDRRGSALNYAPFEWAVSSAVEHCFHTAGVSGSIPLPPTRTRRRPRAGVRLFAASTHPARRADPYTDRAVRIAIESHDADQHERYNRDLRERADRDDGLEPSVRRAAIAAPTVVRDGVRSTDQGDGRALLNPRPFPTLSGAPP